MPDPHPELVRTYLVGSLPMTLNPLMYKPKKPKEKVVSLDMLDDAKRELERRKRNFPIWAAQAKMSEAESELGIKCQQEIFDFLGHHYNLKD